MTDALGPCPVCGTCFPEQSMNAMRFKCLKCKFTASAEHWNLLRRKMTTGEADRLKQETWEARFDLERAALNAARMMSQAAFHFLMAGSISDASRHGGEMTDVLARLMDCPALPRGERLAWAVEADRHVGRMWNRVMRRRLYSPPRHDALWKHAATVASVADDPVHDGTRQRLCDQWRSMARPLRVARERILDQQAEIGRCRCALGRLPHQGRCDCCGGKT